MTTNFPADSVARITDQYVAELAILLKVAKAKAWGDQDLENSFRYLLAQYARSVTETILHQTLQDIHQGLFNNLRKAEDKL